MGRRGDGTMCCECHVRLVRYISGMCKPCHHRTMAEGTRKTSTQLSHEQWRKLARKYNRLIRKGLTQGDIAKLWGLERKCLSQRVYRWKAEAGIAVIPSGNSAPKDRQPTTQLRSYKVAKSATRKADN